MPGNLMFADSSFPHISEGEDTRSSLKKIENYLYMLLENLRYTLQNLEPGNFNGSELELYVKKLMADLVVADVVISNTIITNELYATYGAVADLTVDKLRTDYRRAQKYLSGDTSPIHYIDIHDEQISFRTAETDGKKTEQLQVNGRKFWWTDETKKQMTGEKETGIPVTVYVYAELEKGAFRFRDITQGGQTMVMPVLSLGAGSEIGGEAGKGVVEKHYDGLDLRYVPRSGKGEAGVYLREDGFADVTGRRADIGIDTVEKKITVSPEGTMVEPFEIGYAESGDLLTLTWPDGKQFKVVKT